MSDYKNTFDAPMQRNPATQARHRREVFWQITLPVLVGVAISLALIALAIGAVPAQASIWADISTIWLITPALIAGVIFLAITVASIYLVVKLIQVLPGYAFRIYGFLLLVNDQVRQVSDRLVEPILRIEGFKSSARALARKARRK